MNIPVKPPVSILDPDFIYVPAEQTNVAATFAREIAKMRSPYYESSYDETDRDHHMMFVGGFKK